MNRLKSIRKDWSLIESLITPNSRLLDVGCGEGELIEQLIKNINTHKLHSYSKNNFWDCWFWPKCYSRWYKDGRSRKY